MPIYTLPSTLCLRHTLPSIFCLQYILPISQFAYNTFCLCHTLPRFHFAYITFCLCHTRERFLPSLKRSNNIKVTIFKCILSTIERILLYKNFQGFKIIYNCYYHFNVNFSKIPTKLIQYINILLTVTIKTDIAIFHTLASYEPATTCSLLLELFHTRNQQILAVPKQRYNNSLCFLGFLFKQLITMRMTRKIVTNKVAC